MQVSACRFICFVAVLGAAALLSDLANAAPRSNSSSFPKPEVDQPVANAKGQEVAVLSGGCFWGIQAVFQHVKGVVRATAGYSGGSAKNAEYEIVSTGTTGHAESVEVVYDPSQITLGQLLKVFFFCGTRSNGIKSPGAG